MRRIFFIAFMILVPAAALAAGETVSVRAGEHGDYSRLVIPKAPAGWRIATSDRKIEITFPEKDYAFELSDIIDKRKAHRVLNARVIDGENSRALVLSLTCNCPVRTSKSAGDSIVIDIFNDAPVTLAEEEETPQEPISDAARNAVSATPESVHHPVVGRPARELGNCDGWPGPDRCKCPATARNIRQTGESHPAACRRDPFHAAAPGPSLSGHLCCRSRDRNRPGRNELAPESAAPCCTSVQCTKDRAPPSCLPCLE